MKGKVKIMERIEIKYEYFGKGSYKNVNVIAINDEDITENYEDSICYGLGLWFESYKEMKEEINEFLEDFFDKDILKSSKIVFVKVS